MVEYVEASNVSSQSDFFAAIEEYGDSEALERLDVYKQEINKAQVDGYLEQFSCFYDEENQLIITTVMYEEASNNMARSGNGSVRFVTVCGAYSASGTYIFR